MEQHNNKNKLPRIRIGRLAIDPVFLLIFLFFMFSSMVLLLYIFISAW